MLGFTSHAFTFTLLLLSSLTLLPACSPEISLDASQAASLDTSPSSSPEPLAVTITQNTDSPSQNIEWEWSCNSSTPCQYRYSITQKSDEPLGGSYTDTVSAELTNQNADGTYYLHVQAKDTQGLESEVAMSTGILDNTAPDITGITDSLTPAKAIAWTFGCTDEPCTYRSLINQDANKPTFSGLFGSAPATPLSPNPATDGTWYLHIEAKDIGGNTSYSRFQATLDTTAPEINLTYDFTSEDEVTWSWECADPPLNSCTFRSQIEETDDFTLSGNYGSDTSATKIITEGQDGLYTIKIQAKDEAGNESLVTVDTQTLTFPTPSPPPSPTPSPSPTPPLEVTITPILYSTQNQPAQFDITFNGDISVDSERYFLSTEFLSSSIAQLGLAHIGAWNITNPSNDNANFILSAMNITKTGTISPQITLTGIAPLDPSQFTSPSPTSVSPTALIYSPPSLSAKFIISPPSPTPLADAEFKESLTDSENNRYVVGYFKGAAGSTYTLGSKSDGTAVTLSALGNASTIKNPMLIKYNSSGIIQWAKTLEPNSGPESSSYSADLSFDHITLDSSNHIYVAGLVSGNDTYQVGQGLTIRAPTSPGNFFFLIKYDSSGTPLATRSVGSASGGSTSNVACNSITVNSSALYCAGFFSKAATSLTPISIASPPPVSTLQPISFASEFNATSNAMLIKFDTALIPQWIKYPTTSSGSLSNGSNFKGVALESGGAIHVAGYISGINTFNFLPSSGLALPASPTPTPTPSVVANGYNTATDYTAILVKYADDGSAQWALPLGVVSATDKITGNSTTAAMSLYNTIAIDSSDNIYTAGYLKTASSGSSSYFNPAVWTAASSTYSFLSTTALTVQSASPSYEAPILVKYNSSGTPLWAKSESAADGYQIPNSLSYKSVFVRDDSIYLAGEAAVEAAGEGASEVNHYFSFSPEVKLTLPTGASTHAAIIKFNTDGIPIEAKTTSSGTTAVTRVGNFSPHFYGADFTDLILVGRQAAGTVNWGNDVSSTTAPTNHPFMLFIEP